MKSEAELRAEIVAEAKSWISTPYHLGARVKGAGCDCATLVYSVYRACGLIPDQHIGMFSHDWYCHAKQETYLLRLLRHAYKTAEAVTYPTLAAKPGDTVLIRAVKSRVYNHAGIVTNWPRVVHAVDPRVEEIDASRHPLWEHQQVLLFSPKVFRNAR